MIRQRFVRSDGNYDVDEASFESGLACDPEEKLTQEQFQEESDINTIVKRFGLTGELPGDYRPPMSGDFTGVTDFQTAMNAVRAAEEKFMELPADIRARFGHNPQRLLEFVEDPKNLEEGRKLGIFKEAPEVVLAPKPAEAGV